MSLNGIKSSIENVGIHSNYGLQKKNNYSEVSNPIAEKSLSTYSVENLKANYSPVSFKGNAPRITNAYIITGEKEDLPLLVTKKNESYVIDFDSQTEIIYYIWYRCNKVS